MELRRNSIMMVLKLILKEILKEFAKLRAYVLYVPTCLTCLYTLRAYVPSCLALLRAYVPSCLALLRAYVP